MADENNGDWDAWFDVPEEIGIEVLSEESEDSNSNDSWSDIEEEIGNGQQMNDNPLNDEVVVHSDSDGWNAESATSDDDASSDSSSFFPASDGENEEIARGIRYNPSKRSLVRHLTKRVTNLEKENRKLKKVIDSYGNTIPEDPELVGDTHPAILNSVFLAELFSFLPFNTLKKCRLVCSEWNSVGCSVLRKKSFTEFGREREVPFRDPDPLPRFLNTVLNNPDYENFVFCNKFAFTCVYFNSPDVSKFADVYGKFVRSLTLCLKPYHCTPKLLRTFLLRCPNITTLHIQLPTTCMEDGAIFETEEGESDGRDCLFSNLSKLVLRGRESDIDPLKNNEHFSVDFFTKLLKNCPKIKELHLTCWSKDGLSIALRGIDENREIIPSINTLDLDARISKACMNKLAVYSKKLGMKLKHFSVQGLEKEAESLFKNFLHLQADHLEFLGIQDWKKPKISIAIPNQMKKLKKLLIQVKCEVSNYNPLFSYHNQFPALKHFKVVGLPSDQSPRSHPPSDPFFSLESNPEASDTLEGLCIGFKNLPTFTSIMSIFPFVKQLEITFYQIVNITNLWNASTWIDTLEEVIIIMERSVKNVNTVITGVATDVITRFAVENNYTQQNLGEFVTGPSIGSFKKLRALKFECTDNMEERLSVGRTINDFTGYFLLTQLPKLDHLDIYYPCTITKYCKNRLRKKISQVHIKPFV